MPLPGDFIKTNSYGVVKRSGKDCLVLTDYGLNDIVQKEHYTPKQKAKLW